MRCLNQKIQGTSGLHVNFAHAPTGERYRIVHAPCPTRVLMRECRSDFPDNLLPDTPAMKFLFDLLPVILFFATYKLAGSQEASSAAIAAQLLGDGIDAKQAPILLSTLVVIAATFGQIAWVWLRTRKVDGMLWLSLFLVTFFGGATLFLHNPTFIKWKPTALYWLFALVIVGSRVLLKKDLLKNSLGAQLTLPENVWRKLNFSWAGFFTLMGAANLWIAENFSEEIWVNFKLFGGMGLMIAFVIAQGFFLSPYLREDQS